MLAAMADEHIDAAVVEGLKNRGVDVVSVAERALRQTDDEIILQAAIAEQRVIITCDTDFARLHSEWMTMGINHSGIILWRAKLRIGEAIRSIWRILSNTSAEDAINMLAYLRK